jgi:hypothetical protein
LTTATLSAGAGQTTSETLSRPASIATVIRAHALESPIEPLGLGNALNRTKALIGVQSS